MAAASTTVPTVPEKGLLTVADRLWTGATVSVVPTNATDEPTDIAPVATRVTVTVTVNAPVIGYVNDPSTS